MRTTLHDLVGQAALARGDAPALTFQDTTLGYAELWNGILGFGAGLRALGLSRGDRVAIYLDKRIETVTAIFGTSAADGVFVPLNPLLRPRQVGHILADCAVRVLVTTADRLALLRDELDGCKSVERVVLVGPPARQGLASTAGPATTGYLVDSWDEVCHSGTLVESTSIDLDMAAILYTSGSTGRPKGVVLSHRNLVAGAESVSHYLHNTADDTILAALPLSFDAGFSQLTTGFRVGARVVLMNYLLPGDVVRLCARHQVTGLTCVPPLWIQLADQSWPQQAREHLRYFANTGGRMPRATLDTLRSLFPSAQPYLMYGLTEAFRSTYLDPAEVDRRPESIGKAIPNAEILVVRPDGTLCGPGEEGELVHRGALVALGYWNDAEQTAARFRPAPGRPVGLCQPEPAVWSGDMVTRDEAGFLYFVGRRDEMIKTSGYRVSPTEIEEVAYDTGLVRDAVALGVDDPRLGQRVVLVVTPREDSDVAPDRLAADLHGQLKRTLPPYQLPRQVEIRAELPRTPNGKFDRNRLRQELTR